MTDRPSPTAIVVVLVVVPVLDGVGWGGTNGTYGTHATYGVWATGSLVRLVPFAFLGRALDKPRRDPCARFCAGSPAICHLSFVICHLGPASPYHSCHFYATLYPQSRISFLTL